MQPLDMAPYWQWLLLEVALPLFGASLLYVGWGAAFRVAHSKTTPFTFAWKEALDPFGWLYGVAVTAAQSARKLFVSGEDYSTIAWMNAIAAAYASSFSWRE